MKNIDELAKERTKVVDQVELLLKSTSKDIASFACDEMNQKDADSMRQAFDMLEDYRHEKELAKETGVPSIRMIKYEHCIKLLESAEMQGAYDLYVTHKDNYQALKKQELMWRIFQGKMATNLLAIETAEVIAASDERIVLTYSSEKDTPKEYQWKMKLSIPGDVEPLGIVVERPNGVLLDGTLFIFGNELPVKKGVASMPFDIYQKTYTKKEIAFKFENGKTIPGHPEM